jgi:hypothetical protein
VVKFNWIAPWKLPKKIIAWFQIMALWLWSAISGQAEGRAEEYNDWADLRMVNKQRPATAVLR